MLNQTRRDEARSLWRELPEEQRKALEEEFADQGLSRKPPIQASYKKDGLKSKFVQAEFLRWYAAKLWGTPTDADLLDFALKNQAVLT